MSYSSLNSPDINVPTGQSILGLESPNLPSETSSSFANQDGDLDLSDLATPNQPSMKPFSLLARAEADLSTPTRGKTLATAENVTHDASEEALVEEGNEDDSAEAKRIQAAKLREEKLQSDLFILKKLNASFELFNEALHDTGSANERIAAQLEQTDALLNKYIGILSKSEDFSRLIFDKEWEGAEADEELFEREIREEVERKRREAEEARREMARIEQQRQEEEAKREEKERLEREKSSERAVRSGLRGVRGTRASVRGRGAAPSARPDSATGVPRGIPRRPPSTSARPSGIARASRPT